MPDNTSSSSGPPGQNIVIPEELREKYPELIELVIGSESMNDEERQYWINILPIMTPEQVKNLQDILENEKRQLASIDAKYSKEIEKISESQLLQKMQEERQNRRSKRRETEQEMLDQDEKRAAELLNLIEKH